ncbi:mycofactocin biosynthesis peptidyl-dipeptidase MftE [Labedaea rhizosphaerae]|uniref:Creatinine amidohydrolase n=1 Tax=Labedaea rhizosphaerae TaxID=598644 RepID=A0A4R6S4G0_LABRH|nr:mycofactocin biosynthesis peptidyl-dipeptidase MftE [Labedaea rhizosphaerae]TDP93977.1 creatinine amidohydrolase [Labedaea rhizosphaerae]
MRLDSTASVHGTLVVPVGSTEQHGPHLPFTVDTAIAAALAERLAAEVSDVVIAPPVAYGASGEHAGFPGTLSIGVEATRVVLVELIRSADAFDGVVLVSGHGGNAVPVRAACALAAREGRRVCVWSPTGPADDSHAGWTETSVMLALRPDAVRMDLAAPGVTTPLPELMDRLRKDGVAGVSKSGVLGDPTKASAETGERILRQWTADLVRTVTAWRATDRRG